jgi:hypothetical protein
MNGVDCLYPPLIGARCLNINQLIENTGIFEMIDNGR